MFNTIVGAGAVGAASRYGSGSGSDQKMRLLAAPAPQHWSLLYMRGGYAEDIPPFTVSCILWKNVQKRNDMVGEGAAIAATKFLPHENDAALPGL
jgi:hypothetical protein